MNNTIETKAIGMIQVEEGRFKIRLHKKYRPGLTNINGFSHLQIVWWANLINQTDQRERLINKKPYKNSPDKLGVFATRSQFRPNPILITTIYVEHVDIENGLIHTPYIDAEDGTPLLDIKPYHKYENITNCQVPTWCNHWPNNYEEATAFNWEAEFNF